LLKTMFCFFALAMGYAQAPGGGKKISNEVITVRFILSNGV